MLDHLINGLALGNIYALIAIGFALIFGVANLINFAMPLKGTNTEPIPQSTVEEPR